MGGSESVTTSDGHFRVGPGASSLFLDAQTWTTLALIDDVTDPRFEQALRSAEQRLRVNSGRLGAVQNSSASTSPMTQSRRKCGPRAAKAWSPRCWPRRRGERKPLSRRTARYQSESGASRMRPKTTLGWTRAPSVAATGWYVLNGWCLPQPLPPRLRYRPP
jgi:hypothetical protein